MKKLFLSLTLLLIIPFLAIAQHDEFSWKIGAYSGYNFYKGDLNRNTEVFGEFHPFVALFDADLEQLLSYGGSLERTFGAFALQLRGTKGIFRVNDRHFINEQSPDFFRSLNAETRLYDGTILATYYFDDGHLLSKTALIAPYVSLGFGVTNFEVFGDLFRDDDNARYYYWSDQTIRTLPENDPNAEDALLMTQDEQFETNLTELKTEGEEYNTWTWNIPLALGLKFRLSDRLNLNLEALVRYVNTDYLDDVSGEYPTSFDNELQAHASNPNNQTGRRGDNHSNDYYGLISLSLHYNFGKKAQLFLPPVFYTKDGEGFGNTEITVSDSSKIVITSNPQTDSLSAERITIEAPEPIEEVELPEPLEGVEIATDSIKNTTTNQNRPIVAGAKIESPSILNEEIKLNPLTSQPVEDEVLLEVQKTRLEALRLTQKADSLLSNLDTLATLDKTGFSNVFKQLDSLEKKVQTYQQYIYSVDIRANMDATKPENVAIKDNTAELQREIALMRKKYEMLSRADSINTATLLKEVEVSKAALAKSNEKQLKLEREILKLERQNQRLEKKNDILKEENKAKTTVIVPVAPSNKTEKEKTNSSKPSKPKVLVTPTSKVDSTQQTAVDTSLITKDSVEVSAVVKTEINSLAKELERLKTVTIPQKNAVIDSLKVKVAYLEGQVDGLKAMNLQLGEQLQKRIETLQKQVFELETRTPKKDTVLQNISTPTMVKTNPIINLISEFGVTQVYFGVGSVAVKTEFQPRLVRIATFMKENPSIIAVLKGFTDKSGNPEVNFKLSKRRSEAVKQILMANGIPENRIKIEFFGDSKATQLNDPFARRVEVELVEK